MNNLYFILDIQILRQLKNKYKIITPLSLTNSYKKI
jgi:hypothetical protein